MVHITRITRRARRQSRNMRGGKSPEFDSPTEAERAMTLGRWRAEHPSPQKSVKRRSGRRKRNDKKVLKQAEEYLRDIGSEIARGK